jgi:drug/metabolite transporter (DMT)-like permease
MKTMTHSGHESKLKIILAFAAVYIVWGSTYLAILFAIKDIPPLLLSGIRFLTAGIILFSWQTYRGEQKPDLSSLRKNAIWGTLMLVGGTVSVAWAEQYIPSSVAAIVVTAVPFWFVLLDKRNWSFYFSNKIIIVGLITGFAGMFLLMGFNNSTSSHIQNAGKQWLGIMVILIGDIAWTIGSLVLKYQPTKNSILMNASVQLIAAGLFCLMISIVTGESKNFSFANVRMGSWLGFLYLVIMGTFVAYLSYLWLLKVRPPAQVSTYVYVNPVVALLLGTMIAGEKISALQLVAMTVIFAGVVFVNLARYRRSKKMAMNESKLVDQYQ